ncbi:SCP2 sterol-binding domain-containing protein [soil metagenome]
MNILILAVELWRFIGGISINMLLTFTLPLVQLAINNYLAMDAEIQSQLTPLANKTLHIEVTDFPLNFYVCIHRDKLELLDKTTNKITTHIQGNLIDLGQMAWKSKNQAVSFGKSVTIQGDLDFLQELRDVFLKLDIDWEEQFAKMVGDIMAHNISKALQSFCSWSENSVSTLNQDLTEYLQEEARLLPTRLELMDFMRDTEILRDDVERLEARIKLLCIPSQK